MKPASFIIFFVFSCTFDLTTYQTSTPGNGSRSSRFHNKRRSKMDNYNIVLAGSMRHYETQRLGCLRPLLYSITYRLRLESNAGKLTLYSSLGSCLNCATWLYSLIVESLGFTRFQTTLLGTLDGVIESASDRIIFPSSSLTVRLYQSYYYLHGRQTG